MLSVKNLPELKQSNRRIYILIGLVTGIATLISWEITYTTENWFLVIIVVPIFLTFLCMFALLGGSRSFMLGDGKKSDFDERDKALFLRSNQLAFKIVLLFILIPGIMNPFDTFNGLFKTLSFPSLFFLWFMFIATPQAIHAWLEPDPIPNEKSLGETK